MKRPQRDPGLPKLKTLQKIFETVWPVLCWLAFSECIDKMIDALTLRKLSSADVSGLSGTNFTLGVRVAAGYTLLILLVAATFTLLSWILLSTVQYFNLENHYNALFEANPLVLFCLWPTTLSALNFVLKFVDHVINHDD